MMNEQQKLHAIQDIARKTATPEPEIAKRFNAAMTDLNTVASIKVYLVILAEKRVRESLRKEPYQADSVAPDTTRRLGV